MKGKTKMIYPNVDLYVWIKKYGLKIKSYNCPKCGDVFETTIPIFTTDSAGIVSPLHKCGLQYYLAVLTPRTTESIAFWNTIV